MLKWLRAISAMPVLILQIETLVELFDKNSTMTEGKRTQVLQAVDALHGTLSPFTGKLPDVDALVDATDHAYTVLQKDQQARRLQSK